MAQKNLLVVSLLLILLTIPHGIHAQEVTRRLYLPIGNNITLQVQNNTHNLLVKDYLDSNRLEIRNSEISDVSYSPFGNTIDPSPNQSLVRDDGERIDRQFTSHRKLVNLSLYSAGARFYSPTFATFIQPDQKEGPNRYAYVKNNPIEFIDPDGNSATSVIVRRVREWMSHEGASIIDGAVGHGDGGGGYVYERRILEAARDDMSAVGRGRVIVGERDLSLLSYSTISEPRYLKEVPSLVARYGEFLGAGDYGMVFGSKETGVATKIYFSGYPGREADLLQVLESFRLFPRFEGLVDGGIQMELIQGGPIGSRTVPKNVAFSAASRFDGMEASGFSWEFKPEHVLVETGGDGAISAVRLVDAGSFAQRGKPIPAIESDSMSFRKHLGLNPWSAMRPE